jgi:hypothetical protein
MYLAANRQFVTGSQPELYKVSKMEGGKLNKWHASYEI